MPTSVATAGYNAGLFITSVPSVTMTNEAMTNAGDNATFNDGTTAHQAWDFSAAFTVQTEVDDVQTVTVTGAPTGGTFTLVWNTHTTGTIAYNASAATVQAALVALTGVGVGQVTVTGVNGGPWLVDWTGTLGYAVQPVITLGTNSLTGGTSPSVTIAHTQPGFTWTTQSAGFTIAYAIGQVVFTVPYVGNSNTPACRVTGKYFTIAFLAGVTSIDGTATGATLDTTAMTNPPSNWKTFISGMRSATLKLSTIWVNGGVFLAHMSANDILLLRVYPNQANPNRYQGYGVMTTDSFKSAVSAANLEEIDFNINGQLYYLTV
jgi:hypothetical protein